MNIYQIKTITDYEDALQQIFSQEKAAILNMAQIQERTVLVAPVVVNDKTIAIYYRGVYDKDGQDLNRYEKTELKFGGIYHKHTLYNLADSLIADAFKDSLQRFVLCRTSEPATEIAQKVSDTIKKHMLETYPDLDAVYKGLQAENHYSILERDYSRKDIANEAKEIVLQEKEPAFVIKVSHERYNSIETCIRYGQALADNKEKLFIETEIQHILQEKMYGTTNLALYLQRLEIYYLMLQETEKIKQDINPQDKTYLVIKEKLEAFQKTHPNIKNIRITIDGKDSMLESYIAFKYPEFSIEGKPVVIQQDIVKFLRDYQYSQYWSDGWKATYIKPKLRNEYTKNNERYINKFYPNDIISIESGRNKIYTR